MNRVQLRNAGCGMRSGSSTERGMRNAKLKVHVSKCGVQSRDLRSSILDPQFSNPLPPHPHPPTPPSILHQPPSTRNSPFPPFLALLALFLLSACDDSFNPITENQTEFFAVYGFLDSDADTQFVRVSPVRPLLDTGSRPADTQVFSTQIESGERIAWRDSAVVLNDGTTGLLFYAPFRPERGATYLLEARGADDQVTKALTEVPALLSLRIAPLRQSIDFIQNVTWLGEQRYPARSIIQYTVLPSASSPPVVITLPFNDLGRRTSDGWMFSVNLSRDRTAVLSQLNRVSTDSSVVLLNIHMEIERRSIEWITPGMSSNIQQGFGFFGALSISTDTWTLDPSETSAVGFAAPPTGSQ